MGTQLGGGRSGPAPVRQWRRGRMRRRECECPSPESHPQTVAKADKAVSHPGLDGGESGAEALGDIAIREPAVVREQDRLPLDAGQGLQAAAYRQLLLPGGDLRDDLIERNAGSGSAALAVGGGLFGADAVNGSMMRNGEDPADRSAALAVEACGGTPHLDHDVLGDLFGERR